jgi:hypothetical protein
MSNPDTGYDLDAALINKINKVLNGSHVPSDPYEEAQLRELAFWRWVAYEGYAGKRPMNFFEHQQKFMTSCYSKTGWSIDKFKHQRVFELGCGPVGMIEFVGGVERYAFDPLNDYYSVLFSKLRRSDVKYISKKEQINLLDPFDFGICFNVIDHTDNCSEWFDTFFDNIKPGGSFLFQVNTVKAGFDRTPEHNKMHPSPVTHEQISAMLATVTDNFDYQLNAEPSADNEFFYMAWGQKKD